MQQGPAENVENLMAAQHLKVTRSDCEACANSSVGSGSLFEHGTF